MTVAEWNKKVDKLVADIDGGTFDDEEALKEIGEAAYDRLRELRKADEAEAAKAVKRKLKIGDTVGVRADAALRPKYLLGQTLGEVTDIRKSRCSVKLTKTFSARWREGITAEMPLSAVEVR